MSAGEDGVPVVAGAEGKSQQLCKVCGDRASGKHYGVISCDGCRGFFKRAIRKKMGRLYRCKDNNACIVDVSRRNQCQACRYRRCMEVKMNPNAVQKERSPRPPRDDSHGATAIVAPEISSVYPHLLQNCPSNFFCPYPGASYPYPPQVYYASTSLYPRLAAMQYHQHPGLSLALANALPMHGHVVSQASLAKMEKAMHASGKDLPEKVLHNDVKVEDYSMDARAEDQESEKENQRASSKSPDSGNSSASPDHMTLERSLVKGHATFSAISSSALSLSQSPHVGVSSPVKKTLTPATPSHSAFVMPVNQSPVTSLALAFSSSSATSPTKARSSSSSSLLFKSVTSAATPPLAVVSSPAAIFSLHGGSAPGVASPGGQSAFSPSHRTCLPLPFLQLTAPSASNIIPAAASIHAQPHVSLPSETAAAAAFLDSITTTATAVAPLSAGARSFPVPVSLMQQPHAAMSWASHLPAANNPWPSTLAHLSDKDETQLVTHALQAVQNNIRWVAGLPSFAELSRRDQLVLLEQSWCELLVLTSLQSQLCHELVFLTSVSGLQNKEAVSVELMNISARAHALSIDTEEFSLLKCLALFRPERRGLVDTRTVEAIQENATVMLNQHVQTMGPAVHAPGLRHTKLLLLLRDIQHLDAAALAACVFRRVPHALPLELFVCNLFTMALDRR